MVDPKMLLEKPDLLLENLRRREREDLFPHLENATTLFREKHELLVKVEEKRAERNALAGKLARIAPQERTRGIASGKRIREELARLDQTLHDVSEKLASELRELPNVTLPEVPAGGESENKEIERVGEIARFSFPVKDHVTLGEELGLIDLGRAGKVSGSRFTYLRGDGVLLELALVELAMKMLVKEGFIPVMPPTLIKKRTTQDLGYWHAGNHLNYYLVSDSETSDSGAEKETPLYLIGTSEHAIAPMHSDELLDETELPRRYVGYSPCYRREAGSYGKDVRGILRLHQFEKVEMVSFCTPDQAEAELKNLVRLAREFVRTLELPHRLVELAAGDLSFPSARTIDIETWIPAQERYRETHSISTTTDYQSRRLNTRVKRKGGTEFVHILNGTACAIGRTLVAILENNQNVDGTVRVPDALVPYVGKRVLERSS